MDTNTDTTTRPRLKRTRVTALIAGGLLLGGAAGVIGASAATADSATPSATAGTSTAATGAPAQGSGPVRSDERIVTGAEAATLKAAALKAVPGGTVVRVETDAGDGAYEVHMTKSDGSAVTVKFDSSLTVTAVEDGMGKGDPAPSGQQGQAPGSGSTSTQG